MELEKIKTQTTWNDASASINSNFAKILQALGGSIPEGVDSTLIRILYTADESTGETLTEEQKAYNAETYRMFAEGLTPIVALDGHVGSGIWYEDEELGEAVDLLFKGDLGSAMTIVGCRLREDGSAEAVVNIFTERLLNLTDQFSAQIFFEYYGFLFGLKGVMPTSEYGISEVDVVGYNGRHYVEYNEHDKRFRVEFNADYTIKEIIDITPAGGGGSIDPELVEGYLPLTRDYSDDFNNDFAR